MKTINSCAPSSVSSCRFSSSRSSGNTKRPRTSSPSDTRSTRQQPDHRHDEDCQSSFLLNLLEHFSCSPAHVVEEPREVKYRPPTNVPSSPPVLYVHRYQAEPRDPAPLPTIKSFDTETTVGDSDEESLFGARMKNDLSGRATPIVSNTSSMCDMSPLRMSRCFDDDDSKQAPHAHCHLIA